MLACYCYTKGVHCRTHAGHKGARPKCYHHVNMVPKIGNMRGLEEKQSLKGLELEVNMCKNVNNFIHQTCKIISRFSSQRCIIKTELFSHQEKTQ